jgi:hypothetical protein
LRAGQRKTQGSQQLPHSANVSLPLAAAVAVPTLNTKNDIVGTSAGAAAAGDDGFDSAAAKDDEGLNLRRATRQRAKARVEAICDVVAMTESLVRAALKKMSLPAELRDPIKYASFVLFIYGLWRLARVFCMTCFAELRLVPSHDLLLRSR